MIFAKCQSSELTSATATADSSYRYGYNFDDIGNRKTSAERGVWSSEYTANNLNQYTTITSQTARASEAVRNYYDADGNETLVKTATGVWQVSYNGENRPVLWTQGTNTISMSYDRMGRRVTKNDQRFVYNGYLQIANFRSTTTTSDYNYFIWDSTEPVATRPLVWNRKGDFEYYVFDGNKNVSEVVASNNDVAAHYEYAPFGALTVSSGVSAAANPWRFSSEYAEDDTATVYYNYRHYEPVTGRWMSRDPLFEFELLGQDDLVDYASVSVLEFVANSPINDFDVKGLKQVGGAIPCGNCCVVIDNDESCNDGNKYKIHWNCGRHGRPSNCRGGGSALWPSGKGLHGSFGVPRNIRKCLEGTRWKLDPVKVKVPAKGNCCTVETKYSAIPADDGFLTGRAEVTPVHLCGGSFTFLIVVVALSPLLIL